MFDIENIIDDFAGKKVLIVGDVMLDSYIMGKVERISPEAPVPVVTIHSKENRLGGAANVALNIRALKATPILCSVIGKDDEGNIFTELLNTLDISKTGILVSEKRKTTSKTRILGNNHQLLRLDHEVTNDLEKLENHLLMELYESLLPECDVVILEDYNKGVLTENNIPLIIELANKHSKPIAVDPKKKNFLLYRNVTLFKPNLKEIKEGFNIDSDLKDKTNLTKAVRELNQELNNEITMVTLSEDGVFITDHQKEWHLPAHVRNIADVSGAGDSVISVAALCLSAKIDIKLLAELANLAGGLVCEEAGVVPVNLSKLKIEAMKLTSL